MLRLVALKGNIMKQGKCLNKGCETFYIKAKRS